MGSGGALALGTARNPFLEDELFRIAILGFAALTEAIALFALMMAFLILFGRRVEIFLVLFPCCVCRAFSLRHFPYSADPAQDWQPTTIYTVVAKSAIYRRDDMILNVLLPVETFLIPCGLQATHTCKLLLSQSCAST